MDSQKCEQLMNVAQAYTEKEDYHEAERYYRQALNVSPPERMQELIDFIRATKEKSATQPQKKVGVKYSELGFQIPSLNFSNVVGYKVHKRLLRDFIELPLVKGERYVVKNRPRSTGIILYGPPGTGKTLMARCLSGEFKIPVKIIFVSDILDKLVGGSEKNMRKVFVDAKAVQPCILFFDELDALGASRENANEFTSNDIKMTVNEFLQQLSTLHDNRELAVFVIGATNMPWSLDQAIKRSGRLEHHIFMGPPSFWDRRRILKYYLSQWKSDEDRVSVNWSVLALATGRYSQSDIEKVCDAVVRHQIRDDRHLITTADVQRVLRNKIEGASSLDEWVLKAKDTYLKKSKIVVHRTGFLGLRKKKERVEEQANFTDNELKIYKPLVNYIKRTMRWWTLTSIVRFMARGF